MVGKRWISVLLSLGVLLVLAGTGFSKMSMGVPASCELISPGSKVMKNIVVDFSDIPNYVSGYYKLVLVSDVVNVNPSSFYVYTQSRNDRVIKTIVMEASPFVWSDRGVIRAELYYPDGTLAETQEWCIRVERTGGTEDVVVYHGTPYTEEGWIVIPLYVSNGTSDPVSVLLDSDYTDVQFESNPVVVRGGKTSMVRVMLPADGAPSAIKVYARIEGSGVTKELVVRLPKYRVDVELSVNDRILVDSDIVFLPVTLTNTGDVPLEVTLDLKGEPLGLVIRSERVYLEPGESRLVTAILEAKRLLDSGRDVAQLCVKEISGAELACKNVVIEVPDVKRVEENVEITAEGYTVVFTIENGSRDYSALRLVVKTPEGWEYETDRKVFDLEPFASETVSVTFIPTENAKDGMAVVKVVAEDGTVVAQKVFDLRRSGITGFAGLGGSLVAILIGLIIVAVILALVLRKREKTPTMNEEIKELLKKG